jgi:hypothetical protein
MTIKELKERIKDLDDNMKVGDAGHFGEFLECWGTHVRKVYKKKFSKEEELVFCIGIQNAGEEPD